MPIYEYRCDNCGHELETIQKISESPLKLCPACSTEGLRKKISAAVFRLKGKGWYETDFKSDNKKNVAGDAGDAGDERSEKASDNGSKAEKQDAKSDSGGDKSASSGSGAGESKTQGDSSSTSKPATSTAAKE